MLNSLKSILQKQSPPPSTPTITNPISQETTELKKKYGNLSGKGGLVLHGMLRIHSNIMDNEALQGYEGLPLQLERIMWECYGILALNPNIKTADEINEEWMERYADGWVEMQMENS